MPKRDLASKFPAMRPMTSVPSLWTVNGIGFRLCGERDVDEETGTLVKTQCFCFLFVPLLAIRAYRVAPAGEGWYFIGREPLSSFAKFWNLLLLAIVIGAGSVYGWESYTRTPAHVARTKFAEADRLAAAGETGRAAELLEGVANQSAAQVPAATDAIRRLLDADHSQLAPKDAVRLLQVAAALVDRPGSSLTAKRIIDRGRELTRAFASPDPMAALAVLETIAPLASNRQSLDEERFALLERVAMERPDDVMIAAQLAAVYVSRGDDAKAESLLAPHQSHLGASDGARVLGQIYARQGKLDESYAMLAPYVDERLARFHKLYQARNTAYSRARQQAIEDIRNKKTPNAFAQKFEQSDPTEQDAMFQEFLDKRLKTDPAFRSAQAAIAAQLSVVDVALDLGMITLRRAQASSDAAERRAWIEKAEKTFRSIREQTGETDKSRQFLAQVCYWLGKWDEGRTLFDEWLTAHGRGADELLAVSRMLRNLGDFAHARELAEEAFHTETDAKKKQEAALTRASSPTNEADRIEWLGRANATNANDP